MNTSIGSILYRIPITTFTISLRFVKTVVQNSSTYDSIMEISDRRNDWCFFARVLKVWTVSDVHKHVVPLSMEMVLMDRNVSIYCLNKCYLSK